MCFVIERLTIPLLPNCLKKTQRIQFFNPRTSANLKASLTDEVSTHDMPNSKNIKFHETLVLSQ